MVSISLCLFIVIVDFDSWNWLFHRFYADKTKKKDEQMINAVSIVQYKYI